jgi:hypothetical protein
LDKRLVGFDFAERIVELDLVSRLLQERDDFRVPNAFAHDRDNDVLHALLLRGRGFLLHLFGLRSRGFGALLHGREARR